MQGELEIPHRNVSEQQLQRDPALGRADVIVQFDFDWWWWHWEDNSKRTSPVTVMLAGSVWLKRNTCSSAYSKRCELQGLL